ncbi:helix-turn-helix domain-containing protein [Streptomyces sp. NPDC059080]|uniref:helix-turn-helix domain-containing protein n=1 Tax=Streptomyces sp. NPDC059080 TaxID=3346718 RepID=UPI0036B8E961
MVNWSSRAISEATRRGDYGKVVRLARVAAQLSQRRLGEACGTSQSAISRLESRGVASYDTAQLAQVASHLQIPPNLVGLADHAAVPVALGDRTGTDAERRSFLSRAAAVAVSSVVPATSARPMQSNQAAALRTATSAFRRLDGSTPSRQLAETVLAHLRMTQRITQDAENDQDRSDLAAVGSEVASLAGWLHWDIGDHGSARTWYGVSIKAARRSRNPLLAAYQLGSLAQFEAHAGNSAQGLTLTRSARKQLGPCVPAIADAWLFGVEALAHAAAGDVDSADAALTASVRHVRRIEDEEAPPWPWVFSFTEAKVAAVRVSCGAYLGRPRWVFSAPDTRGAAATPGHEKQRALLMLDIASGHMASGRLDGAFTMATQALEIGLRYQSGRIVERARGLRRSYSTTTPPKVVRDFDDRLYGVFM